MKLQARLSESQAMIEQLTLKLAQLEKAKAKASTDAADMAQQLDQVSGWYFMEPTYHSPGSNPERCHGKEGKAVWQVCTYFYFTLFIPWSLFRIVGEWKGKVDGLGMDLDTAQKETRNVLSELFKVKNAYDEAIVQLEEVRR